MINVKSIWFHLPLAGYALLIYILSSIPSLTPPDLGINAEDKLIHCAEYAILGALILRSISWSVNPISTEWLWLAWLFGVLYGISDEIHQYFVPNRVASPWDALADAIGVAIGVLVYWKYLERKKIADAGIEQTTSTMN